MQTAAIALACGLAAVAVLATVSGVVRADGQPPYPPTEGVTPPPMPENEQHPILALPVPTTPSAQPPAAEPAKPADNAQPAHPAQPADNAKPSDNAKPADAAKPVGTAKPADTPKKADVSKKPDAGRRADTARSRMCFNANETREKVVSHKLTDPMRAMRAGKLQGEALKARLCRWKTDEFIYEVSVLRKDGRLIHVYMNAQNGKTVSAQAEDHKSADEHH